MHHKDAGNHPHFSSFLPKAQQELFAQIRQRQSRGFRGQVTPIFIISCDRITVLIQSMLSYYKNLAADIEIVIHDNATTYPPARAFLQRLEEEGIEVHWSQEVVRSPRALGNVRQTIDKWFQKNDAEHYVVTDPDIAIEAGSEDLLSALAHTLKSYDQIDAAGPMLRRDDIPSCYPLKDFVLKQQGDLYKVEKQLVLRWGQKALLLQSGWIDTSFALYRKKFAFRPLNRSLQTYEPYVAKHLDWYLDVNNLAPDQTYYRNKNNPVGHWSSTWLPKQVQLAPRWAEPPHEPQAPEPSYRILRPKKPELSP